MDSIHYIRKLSRRSDSPITITRRTLYDEDRNYVTYEELVYLDDVWEPLNLSDVENDSETRGMVAGYMLNNMMHKGHAFELVFQNLELMSLPFNIELIPNMFNTTDSDFLDIVLRAWLYAQDMEDGREELNADTY